MFGFERGKLEQTIEAKRRGDEAAGGMYWDPHAKRIQYGPIRDPDSSCLNAAQSDLGHA